jgi:hypothetical protein
MRDVVVFGERCADLAAELTVLDFDIPPAGTARVSGTVPMDGPLLRAMYRAEAELLLGDVEAMAAGIYEHRTPEQRRADAFVLLFERIGEAVRSVAAEHASDPPSGKQH